MKIAIVGGTHGNEPTGVEVIKAIQGKNKINSPHEYQCFQGNLKAFEIQKRYVDCDLNRAFGKNGIRKGYEKQRAEEIEKLIKGKFDLCIDLHTTTTNMGNTAILNNTHPLTRNACVYLQKKFPDIKLIEEDVLDDECKHLNRLAPAGITIEVGPVANNVLRAELVINVYNMVKTLLEWDYSTDDIDLSQAQYFKVVDTIFYPEEDGWYVHPKREQHDFNVIKKGDPLFININGETINYEKDLEVYPFFVNEAAYLNSKSAMILSVLKKGWS